MSAFLLLRTTFSPIFHYFHSFLPLNISLCFPLLNFFLQIPERSQFVLSRIFEGTFAICNSVQSFSISIPNCLILVLSVFPKRNFFKYEEAITGRLHLNEFSFFFSNFWPTMLFPELIRHFGCQYFCFCSTRSMSI